MGLDGGGGGIGRLGLLGQAHVVDGDVHAIDLQARHALDGGHDIAADGLRELVDGDAVLRDDGDGDGGRAVRDLDVDALADVLRAAEGLANGAHHAGAAATEGCHAGDLAGGDTGDLGDDRGLDGRGAELGLEILIDVLLGGGGLGALRGFRRGVLGHGVVPFLNVRMLYI